MGRNDDFSAFEFRLVQLVLGLTRMARRNAKFGARIALPRAMSEGRVDFPTISANIFEVDPTP